jgi:hypothetical protein
MSLGSLRRWRRERGSRAVEDEIRRTDSALGPMDVETSFPTSCEVHGRRDAGGNVRNAGASRSQSRGRSQRDARDRSARSFAAL